MLKRKTMRELTKAEEQIMQVLWSHGPAFVREIISWLPDPKPAYSTVSTIVRILETKGFVKHKVFGPTHQYAVNVSKEEYSHFTLRKVLDNYFDGSINKMVSFFSRKEDLNLKDVEELLNLLKQKNEEHNG